MNQRIEKSAAMMFLLSGIFPGLKGLLRYGRWSHLAVALVFAFFLDFFLVLNYYWFDFIPLENKKWVLLSLAGIWCLCTYISARLSRIMENCRRLDQKGDLFLEALTHYLKGHWPEAVSCAKALLRYNQQDAEAMLLLATLYRHTRRLDEAQNILARLELLESADKWYYEILLEKKELQALLSDSIQTEEETHEDSTQPTLKLVVPDMVDSGQNVETGLFSQVN